MEKELESLKQLLTDTSSTPEIVEIVRKLADEVSNLKKGIADKDGISAIQALEQRFYACLALLDKRMATIDKLDDRFSNMEKTIKEDKKSIEVLEQRLNLLDKSKVCNPPTRESKQKQPLTRESKQKQPPTRESKQKQPPTGALPKRERLPRAAKQKQPQPKTININDSDSEDELAKLAFHIGGEEFRKCVQEKRKSTGKKKRSDDLEKFAFQIGGENLRSYVREQRELKRHKS